MNVDWQSGAPVPPFAPAGDFPQLAVIHDAARVGTVLDRLRPGPAAGPWSVENIWYLPRRSLWAIYAAPAPGGGKRIASLSFRMPGSEAVAAEGIPVPELDAQLWEFPDDPGLPAIRVLVDCPDALADVLPPVARPVGWSLLSYLPGTRCTVLHASAEGTPVAVGKLQSGAAWTHRAMESLQALSGGAFALAPPLALDAERGIRWEGFVPGERLDRIADPGLREQGIRAAVAGLVALHRTMVPGLPTRDAVTVLSRITGKTAKRVDAVLPHLSERLRGVCRRLEAMRPCLDDGAPLTLHGDFHPANILIRPAGAVFIDLDAMALGDPAYDLALFATRLLLIAQLQPAQTRDLVRIARSLPDLYVEKGGRPIPSRTFTWYVAALLAGRQVHTCIRHFAPGLGSLAEALVAGAEAALDGQVAAGSDGATAGAAAP